MRKFLKSIKSEITDSLERTGEEETRKNETGQFSSSFAPGPPPKNEWLQFRKHRGVNLGMSSTCSVEDFISFLRDFCLSQKVHGSSLNGG